MNKPDTYGLWSTIKVISETQEGRQALSTTGFAIASAYMGYIGPEIFTSMHDVLAMYAVKYPFLDPITMSNTLWDGAKYFSASVVDYIANVSDAFGAEMSKTFRDSLATCREFLGRGSDRSLEVARAGFIETAEYLGGFAAQVVETARNVATSGVEFMKANWGKIIATAAAAKQAYEYFDAGADIYKKWFGKAKEEVSDKSNQEINVTINTAIGGPDALRAADLQIKREAMSLKMDVSFDKIIWVSDQLHDRIGEEGAIISNLDTVKTQPAEAKIDLALLDASSLLGDRRAGEKRRTSRSTLLESPDFSAPRPQMDNIRVAPAKNTNNLRESWSSSMESVRRLEKLSLQTRKTSGMKFDLSDPLAFKKGTTTRAEKFDTPGASLLAANDNKINKPADDRGPGLM